MKLRTFLKRNRLTRKAFAKRVGISPQAVGYYVKGQRRPSLATAIDIVKATEGAVTLRDLLDAVREPEEKDQIAA